MNFYAQWFGQTADGCMFVDICKVVLEGGIIVCWPICECYLQAADEGYNLNIIYG